MLGEHSRSEPMFYYIRMDELIPESHLLRLVDKHIDLSFIRSKVKHLYSHTGRPYALHIPRIRHRESPDRGQHLYQGQRFGQEHGTRRR